MKDDLNLQIINLLNQGRTVKEIAAELQCGRSTVYARIQQIKRDGAEFINVGWKMKEYKLDEIDEKIIELKQQGYTQIKMAEILNISPTAVCNRIKRIKASGVEYVDFATELENINNQILSLRKKGLNLKEISDELGMSISTISYRIKVMKSMGRDIKKTKRGRDYTKLDNQIQELRRQGITEKEIAEKLNISISVVSFRLTKMKEMGINFPELDIEERNKDEQVINMRKDGLNIKQIADKLNVSADAISKRIKKMRSKGIDVDKTKNKTSKIKGKVSEEKLAKAVMNLAKSKNATESQMKVIAQYYGVDLDTVLKLSKYIDEK